ncbi:uncharacterized protein LOC132549200 [Ylistrum balloti]|uniref:uncharacterized protein LOC132549200 n=1 Tax=Ylistrum balloti TaxID=509963 RepID=UPI0029058EBB|nr:uncharacterized protein LOC132549200 [Ylistrum balloti]
MPPTRQQRYTCQISIGSTRKSPGKQSADQESPDVVLDSEKKSSQLSDDKLRYDGKVGRNPVSPVQQTNNRLANLGSAQQSEDGRAPQWPTQQSDDGREPLEGVTQTNNGRAPLGHVQQSDDGRAPQWPVQHSDDGRAPLGHVQQTNNGQAPLRPEQQADDGRTSLRSGEQTEDTRASLSPVLTTPLGHVKQNEDVRTPLTAEHQTGGGETRLDDERVPLSCGKQGKYSKYITPELMKSYLDFFNKADTFSNGQLTVHQFRDAVVELGFLGTSFQIARMFVDLNPNEDLIVTLDAFMTEMCKVDSRKWTKTDIEDIFHSLDLDGDGMITENDIETTLERLNKVKTDEDIQRMITRYDVDRDGALCLQDFVKGYQRDQRK